MEDIIKIFEEEPVEHKLDDDFGADQGPNTNGDDQDNRSKDRSRGDDQDRSCGNGQGYKIKRIIMIRMLEGDVVDKKKNMRVGLGRTGYMKLSSKINEKQNIKEIRYVLQFSPGNQVLPDEEFCALLKTLWYIQKREEDKAGVTKDDVFKDHLRQTGKSGVALSDKKKSGHVVISTDSNPTAESSSLVTGANSFPTLFKFLKANGDDHCCTRYAVSKMIGKDIGENHKCSDFSVSIKALEQKSVPKSVPPVPLKSVPKSVPPVPPPQSSSQLSELERSIINSITQLLHAHDFRPITERVSKIKDLDHHHPVFQIAIHFINGLSHFKLSSYGEARLSLSCGSGISFQERRKGDVSLYPSDMEFSSKHSSKAVDLYRKVSSPESVATRGSGTSFQERRKGDVSLCNIYLGDVEFSSKHFSNAVDHYRKASMFYSPESVATLFKMVPPSLSTVHAKCGSALRNCSRMVDAVQEYQKAIKEAKTDKDLLAANTSLGNLYQSLGENSSALTHYEKSVELSEKLSDFVSLGWAHGNMGNAYLGLLQKDKALYHLQKSLDLTVEYERTPQAIGRTYNNLGTAYQSLGDLDKAQEYYDLALSQAVYGNDTAGQARVYGNIGNVLMLRKKYDEAIPHYTEVLRLSKDRSTLSTAHHNRGCAYYEWAENKKDKLLKNGETEASQSADDIKLYIHGPDFKDSSTTVPPKVIDSITELYRKGSKDLEEVVKHHEENLENIKGSSKGLTLSVSLFETNSRTFHRYQDCLVNLGEYTSALRVAEQSRARTLGELMLKRKGFGLSRPLTSPLPFDQIKSIASSKACPIMYLSYTGARLLGWVFIPSEGKLKMNMFEVPLKDDQFNGKSFDYHLRYSLTEALVERSFEMYRGIEYNEESSEPVQNLYGLIAKPLLTILEKCSNISKISKVVIISDSYTALLPYSSLQDPDTKHFHGDRFRFQLMPSLLTMGVLDQLPDTNVVRLPRDTHNMCIVGNPHIPQFIYNKETWSLGKLPHAKKEAEWVAHILKTAPVLEEQATKTAILMRIMSAKIIHIATHGSASAGFLAFGAMTSPNQIVDAKEVLLYPEDVEKLNISPALVVLSSCDSGRGTVKADGIQGMARAFILAGAQAVLTTLWRVPDESASIFMQFFYQYMVDGLESTLALQKAIHSIRCFSKYSQYIHWSGYQLTGRDVHFENTTNSSAHIIQQRIGPGTVFSHLKYIKKLEAKFMQSPCYPTDVKILRGAPGIKPSGIMIDFIHNNHGHFSGGIFWINCQSPELISASVHYIEKCIGTGLDDLPSTELHPTLIVLDGMTKLPGSDSALFKLMQDRHVHFVVLYKHYLPPDDLVRAIDRKLLRGSEVHEIDALTKIHSTQLMVYSIQKEIEFPPNNNDQEILEKLSDFMSGSPVLVDIASELLLSRLKNLLEKKTHEALEKFAKDISLNVSRKDRTSSFVGEDSPTSSWCRDIATQMKDVVPSLLPLSSDQRDAWDTNCEYDSWDSLSELIRNCDFSTEVELLLNCLSIFGCSPIPIAVVTSLSSIITKTSGKTHLTGSMLKKLMKMRCVKIYPSPVVIHSSIKPKDTANADPDFIYVPQFIANFLWKEMEDRDKVFALTTCYISLSNLPTRPNHTHFLLGLTSLMLHTMESNFDLMGEECYQEVYRLYLKLLQDIEVTKL